MVLGERLVPELDLPGRLAQQGYRKTSLCS